MAENNFPLDQRTFNSLKRLYIIALSAIALSVVVSQFFIRRHLVDQESDSRVINVAGRQRMLSQKLTKLVLMLAHETSTEKIKILHGELMSTQQLWKSSHNALQHGNDSLGLPNKNSPTITKMFQSITPYFKHLLTASNRIIQQLENNTANTTVLSEHDINLIKQNEGQFLLLMDEIVNQYDTEAYQKIVRLRSIEFIIMIVTLLLLLAEFLFIFWPTAKRVKQSIYEILNAEKNALKMAIEADKLSQAKEASVRQLKAFNRAVNQTLLYVRIRHDGQITYIGDKFSSFFKVSKTDINTKFSDIISNIETEKRFIEDIIAKHGKTGWQGEIRATQNAQETRWLEMSMIPFNTGQDKSELLIICIDNTERKTAQLAIDQLSAQRFTEQMNHQNVIAQKIIENQENEQKRIAKDIHDGIGQMLTALKFTLESIDLADLEKAFTKIEDLKALTTDIMKGVRNATFNLTPPELTDLGIIPALTELTKELGKLTGKNIVLINKSNFNQRLGSLVEINIYRITQEAINNAIKYAQSSHILVTISHSKDILSLIIDDNGIGFNPKSTKKKGSMGLTFMQERIKFIHGRFFITSSPGEGTRITLNIPINQQQSL